MGEPVIADEIVAVVTAIHAAPQRLVYLFAGAGSMALWWLHAVAGSSRTVLEAIDAYTPEALHSYLSTASSSAVSVETAHGMAAWAQQRARALGGDLGVGLTAAIATDRERRGANRCIVAIHHAQGRACHELRMHKGARERLAEEELVSRTVLHAIAVGCGVRVPTIALLPGEQLVEHR